MKPSAWSRLAGMPAQIVINDERLGLAGNWNQCVALSRTPWFDIFDQDDVMLPGHLYMGTRQAEVDDSRSGVESGLIAGPVRMIDEDSQLIAFPAFFIPAVTSYAVSCRIRSRVFRFSARQILRLALHLEPASLLASGSANHEAHAEVGGFDASSGLVVDWDFWYRVAPEFGGYLEASTIRQC